MNKFRKSIVFAFLLIGSYALNGYGSNLSFDNTVWHYDAENDVYWQIGVVYCATPETKEYESLGIYVPGAYLSCDDNGMDIEARTSPGTGESTPVSSRAIRPQPSR